MSMEIEELVPRYRMEPGGPIRVRYVPAGESSVRVAKVVPPPPEIAGILELPAGVMAIRRRAILRGEDGHVEITNSWFDSRLAAAAPRLLDASPIREGALAYCEQTTKVRSCVARDLVGARLATDDEARELGLTGPPRIAVLVIRHVPIDDHARPLAVLEAVFAPDRWVLEQDHAVPG